jgi:hypothetical protein
MILNVVIFVRILFLLFIHLLICAYIVWAISSPCTLPLLPTPLASRQNLSALFSNFVEEKTKEIIRKTAFLLV